MSPEHGRWKSLAAVVSAKPEGEREAAARAVLAEIAAGPLRYRYRYAHDDKRVEASDTLARTFHKKAPSRDFFRDAVVNWVWSAATDRAGGGATIMDIAVFDPFIGGEPSPAAVPRTPKRGPQADVSERVRREMRVAIAIEQGVDLSGLREKDMARMFGASRDVCRKARESLMKLRQTVG